MRLYTYNSFISIKNDSISFAIGDKKHGLTITEYHDSYDNSSSRKVMIGLNTYSGSNTYSKIQFLNSIYDSNGNAYISRGDYYFKRKMRADLRISYNKSTTSSINDSGYSYTSQNLIDCDGSYVQNVLRIQVPDPTSGASSATEKQYVMMIYRNVYS